MPSRSPIEGTLRESYTPVLEPAGFSRLRRVWSRSAGGYEQRVGLDTSRGRHVPVFGLFHDAMLPILWPDELLDPAQMSQCFALGSTTALLRPAQVVAITAEDLSGNGQADIVRGLQADLSGVVNFFDRLPTLGDVIELLAALLDKPSVSQPFTIPSKPSLLRLTVAALATIAGARDAATWRQRASDDWTGAKGTLTERRLRALTKLADTST